MIYDNNIHPKDFLSMNVFLFQSSLQNWKGICVLNELQMQRALNLVQLSYDFQAFLRGGGQTSE